MDGLVYGAMIGLGFQVIENVQYFMFAAPVERARRALWSACSSCGWSFLGSTATCSSAGLWDSASRTSSPSEAGRWAGGLACSLLFAFLAWAAHFVWNSPWLESLMTQGTGAFVLAPGDQGPAVLDLAAVAGGVRPAAREGRAFGGSDAVGGGQRRCDAEEFHILRAAGRRRRGASAHEEEQGAQAPRAVLKQLMREQMNLALFHTKVSSADHPALEASGTSSGG